MVTMTCELWDEKHMKCDDAIVFVVDDDDSVREALSDLIASVGLDVAAFGSASEFLTAHKPDRPCCLILDLKLPDVNGLELQNELANENGPPVIFISGYGDIPTSVRAMKAGAIEFLPKPFRNEDLLKAIDAALSVDREARHARSKVSELRKHYSLLTAREKEVLPFVVAGFANKETAADLGTSEITIAVHRGQIMRKMGARSLAELVRMSDELQVPSKSRPA